MTLPKQTKRIKYFQRANIFLNSKNLRFIKNNIDYENNTFKQQINQLESTTIEETINLDDFELPECPICYNVLEQDTNYCVTDCNHTFCFNCIARSIRRDNKCPLCRATLDKSDEINNLQSQTMPLSSQELATLLQNATVQGLERERRVLHEDLFDDLDNEDPLFHY